MAKIFTAKKFNNCRDKNFGRIKNQYFDLYLNTGAQKVSRIITIWARYYQFLEVDGFKSMRVLFDNLSDTGVSAILP